MAAPKSFPEMISVRQEFLRSEPIDVRACVRAEFAKLVPFVKSGARIAVGVGSRGITNLQAIVAEALSLLRTVGAKPFIVPAMGSHGGATSEGQTELLAEYGITEAALKVPIHAAMETERIGTTEDGVDVIFSREALRADGVIVINRVKPHTDFSGKLGSGILKMLVVGLGKRDGAANFHLASARLGYERVLRSLAKAILKSASVVGGIAIVENQFHDTARIQALRPSEMEQGEEGLFTEATRLMPRLPFDDVDLLIVDRMGKNISGAGLDPNVTGRWVHGYSSMLNQPGPSKPLVRRLFVRELTPETHGNAIGIGMADLTTTRLVQSIDRRVTAINALTALTPNCAKIPIYFDTDQEAIERAFDSIGAREASEIKVVRIADTLSLGEVEVSAAYSGDLPKRRDLKPTGQPQSMRFDAEGNLMPLGAHGD